MAWLTTTPKERRLLAVLYGVAACLASIIAWMEWPRGDARFVGEWTVAAGERPPLGKLILRRNGTGLGYYPLDSDEYESFVWRVEDDRLIYGHPKNWLTNSVNWCWRQIAPRRYWPLLPPDNPYPILDVKTDEIRIRNTWNTNTFRRIR